MTTSHARPYDPHRIRDRHDHTGPPGRPIEPVGRACIRPTAGDASRNFQSQPYCELEVSGLRFVSALFLAAGIGCCRWREILWRGGRVSVIWRTSCWKQARDATAGKAAAVIPVRVGFASTMQSIIAKDENSRTTNHECMERRWCRADRKMESEATIHGP